MAPRRNPAVEAYIAAAPESVRSRLREVRETILSAAPDSTEVISYQMPGYRYPGFSHRGMFAWFGLHTDFIGLYLRTPTIADHRRELARYRTTKSAVHLPLDEKVPGPLVRRLVRASARTLKRVAAE